MAFSFSITHKKPELIAPSQPTPNEIKALSDLDDQESLRSHYPMIMFYKNNPCMTEEDPVKIIREAVAKTLVYYYPYAGRLIEGPNEKLMVHCTADGVGFMEAEAAASLEQLGDTVQPPCPYPELLFAGHDGILGSPLMFIQVTRFTCGGFVLAIRFNHVMSDAIGSLQFVTAVSEMAKGASTPSVLPVWERELLTARHPPHVTHMHLEYMTYREDKSVISSTTNEENLVRKSFTFGPREIKAIKTTLPPNLHSSSKFNLISACLWRSRARALQFDPEDNMLFSCMVNGRDKNCLDLPQGYYANAIFGPGKVTKAKVLCESPLGYAIKLVKEARTQVTEAYARSTIDFVATTKGGTDMTNPGIFIVSDASKLGFDEVDFGWGKPTYGGTMYGGTQHNNVVYARYRNQKGEDVMVAAICLPKALMEKFENELKKLIWENSNTLNGNKFPSKL